MGVDGPQLDGPLAPTAGRAAARWLQVRDAARDIGGARPRWVRKQVEEGRLRARVLLTGARPTYRIREADLRAFCSTDILEDSRDR